MSRIKNKMIDFLEDKGYKLGYHEGLMPKIADINIVSVNNIEVWKYMGYRSEKSFYSKRKPSALALKEIIEKYGMQNREYWEKKREIKYLPVKFEGDLENGPLF